MTPRLHIPGPPCGTCGSTEYFALSNRCVQCVKLKNVQRGSDAAIRANAERMKQKRKPMDGARYEDV